MFLLPYVPIDLLISKVRAVGRHPVAAGLPKLLHSSTLILIDLLIWNIEVH